ncbi:uncharacterized protein [Rutidosis leptorrhynchoides]|uniref:uncharacterized protein n=1 Tax=Rutidosis leptorrhynchoides TaxID=125765 RepID=UPI003A99B495
MVQSYQDAMTLCREFDNPDLFITFTSNPKWTEIEGMLSYIEGQRVPDRPKIVARVFKQKLDAMMADIMKAHIFGTCEAGIYIIEFQKRGLPHVHMLIWLTSDFKCKTPEDIDDIIFAEIPSKTQDPDAYKAVTEYMLHGLCGGNILDAPCIIDKKYLLLKYNAHINVEWCNRSRAIKYLFKYLNKGPDRVTIVIQENLSPVNGSTPELVTEVDEIKNYLDCRYLSPCEAVWRMFSFNIHFSKPSVIKLSYHLPNHHTITLCDSDNLPTLLHRESIKETMFTEWFELNKRDPSARNLTYAKIPKNYELNWEALVEDILYKKCKLYNLPDLILSESQLRNYCLLEIQDILNKHGIASLLLPGGRTAHSRFVIPLELMENSTCGIKQKTHLAELMQEVRLIIWDEAPMTQRFAFEALDKMLKDILGAKNEANRSKLFGGVPILLGGDFRQILPVIPKGKRQEIVQACINRSELWQSCQLHTLSRIMRVNEFTADGQVDPRKQQFNKWVLDIGDGKVQAVCKDREEEPTWIEIPDEFIVKSDKPPIDAIIDTIFPDFLERHKNEDYLSERAILTPRNDDADQINKHMFKKLHGQTMIYKSSDEICKGSTDAIDQHQSYPVEYLNKLNFPGVPPHKLKLKIGQPIMLLRNLYPSAGMCNGTRLIITAFQKFVIQAQIITGSHVGNMVIIPRIVLTSAQTKWPFVMKRIQFPVRPCYAMTINKSQGQSLDYIGLYLPKPVFSDGQLYVALSRVTNPKGLKIVMVGDTQGRLHNFTRNVVYKETFHNHNQSGRVIQPYHCSGMSQSWRSKVNQLQLRSLLISD